MLHCFKRQVIALRLEILEDCEVIPSARSDFNGLEMTMKFYHLYLSLSNKNHIVDQSSLKRRCVQTHKTL